MSKQSFITLVWPYFTFNRSHPAMKLSIDLTAVNCNGHQYMFGLPLQDAVNRVKLQLKASKIIVQWINI